MLKSSSPRILIIAPSWVGDMVMAQTIFIALKKTNPDCVIDVLAPAWCKPLLERMSEVRRSFDLPFAHGELNISGRRALGKSLRGQYDQAIVLPNSFKSAMLPWFADIPLRTGWCGEMRYGLLNDLRILDKQKYPLMVQRFVALTQDKNSSPPQLREIIAPNLEVHLDAQDTARKTFAIANDRVWIGLCPGAEFGPAKRWPSAHYAALATQLIDYGYSIALFGSKKDQTDCGEIIATIPAINRHAVVDLSGRTNLTEAIDLLAAMHAVVSNDSGLMHIAAAVQKPLIAIYGSTSPSFTPPLAPQVEILQEKIHCSPCFQRECPKAGADHLRCLNELLPQKVFAALQTLLPQVVEVRA
jgi:heptosyltransferase-2